MDQHTYEKQSFHRAGSSVFFGKRVPIRQMWTKLLVFVGLGINMLVLRLLDISCLWQQLLHIPCPGCGMTRAWLAFFRGDIAAAFGWHFMFPAVPLLFFYIFFEEYCFCKKRHWVILGGIGIGFLIHWMLLLCGGG